jgi:hypothetical protein
MGFLDSLFGSSNSARPVPPVPPNAYGRPAPQNSAPSNQPPRSADEIAVERYRYLLRTAPPETIERVHAEAFSKLTEPQRQLVLSELSAGLPPQEQPRSTEPHAMARAATRAEYMNPGFMERTLGPQRQGPSSASMFGSSMLGTVVGFVVGSALVSSFMGPAYAYDQGYDDGATDASTDGHGETTADAGQSWGDSGSGWGGDAGGGDIGGFGDFGF